MALTLRPPDASDIPPLLCLLQDHWDVISDDFDIYDPEFLVKKIGTEELLVIDSYGYAAGVVWYADLVSDLHLTIHLIINPKYYRPVVQEKLIPLILKQGFDYGVQKIKARANDYQKHAIKLLERHHFRFVGRQNMETRKHGKMVDVCLYEMKHSRFRHYYGGTPECPVLAVNPKASPKIPPKQPVSTAPSARSSAGKGKRHSSPTTPPETVIS